MPILPPYSREQTGDAAADRIQRTLEGLRSLINGYAPASGKLIEGLAFTAGQSQDIAHGLGRIPVGYAVHESVSSVALLRRNDAAQSADFRRSFIRLVHDGASATTVKLWVF